MIVTGSLGLTVNENSQTYMRFWSDPKLWIVWFLSVSKEKRSEVMRTRSLTQLSKLFTV